MLMDQIACESKAGSPSKRQALDVLLLDVIIGIDARGDTLSSKLKTGRMAQGAGAACRILTPRC